MDAPVRSEEQFAVIPNYDRKLEASPLALKDFMDTHKGLVWDYMFLCVERAIMTDADETILFRLGDSDQIAKIVRENFPETLRQMDAHFLKTEQYEKVQKCRKLIDTVHINQLLRAAREP